MSFDPNDISKIYLKNVLSRIPGNVYWKDKQGKYLGCNLSHAEMSGFPSSEYIIGKTDYELPWKDIADILFETDQRIMNNKIAEELIETPTLPNGQRLIMITNKAPLYNENNEVIGIIGTSLDITQFKQAEAREKLAIAKTSAALAEKKAEEESKRALMVLAGSIVHDLRTPLLILNGINQNLALTLNILLEYYNLALEAGLNLDRKLTNRESKLIKDIKDLPSEIDNITDKMKNFINDNLKAIKKSTCPEMKDEDFIECISYKVIENALNSYPFKDKEKSLIHWDRSYFFHFLGNPLLFLRIIFNLLSNSLYQIEANNKGNIFISSNSDEQYNIITFKDTAGGASPQIISRIFEGYTTTKEQGTGVGLSFCKLIMRNFGGDIICHSVEGDFIEFKLLFPKLLG